MIKLRKMTQAEAYLYLDFVGWRLFGWNTVDRMKHHPNSNACKAIDEALNKCSGLTIAWVKGHVGIAGNERADELSLLGRQSKIPDQNNAPDDLDAEYCAIMAG